MKTFRFPTTISLLFVLIASTNGIAQNQDASNFTTVSNSKGPTLGYSTSSGITILTIDGLKFKDLNKNGKLDAYEDWRLPMDARAKDLASKMTIEQIAGLMLYSCLLYTSPSPRD